MWGETYLGEHFLLGELPDNLNGFRGTLFELNALQLFVHIKSVVSASRLQVVLDHNGGRKFK